MAKAVKPRHLPQSTIVADQRRAAKKAWVRQAAVKLFPALHIQQSLTHFEVRRVAAHVAVEIADSIWSQVEGRYMEVPKNETGENHE